MENSSAKDKIAAKTRGRRGSALSNMSISSIFAPQYLRQDCFLQGSYGFI